MQCDVSILLPTKDRPDALQSALRNIRSSIPEVIRFEILVGDASRTPYDDPVVQSFPGLPLAATINRLASMAHGEFLMNLNDDTVLYPWTVSTALDYMRVLRSMTLGLLFHEDYGARRDEGEPCHTFLTIPEFWMVRPSTYQRMGGMDEGYARHYLDTDFGFRALTRGVMPTALSGACLKHCQPHDHVQDEIELVASHDQLGSFAYGRCIRCCNPGTSICNSRSCVKNLMQRPWWGYE